MCIERITAMHIGINIIIKIFYLSKVTLFLARYLSITKFWFCNQLGIFFWHARFLFICTIQGIAVWHARLSFLVGIHMVFRAQVLALPGVLWALFKILVPALVMPCGIANCWNQIFTKTMVGNAVAPPVGANIRDRPNERDGERESWK